MASNKDYPDYWECDFCHFHNPGQLRPGGSCEICGAWSCTSCTYLNFPQKRRCRICSLYKSCNTDDSTEASVTSQEDPPKATGSTVTTTKPPILKGAIEIKREEGSEKEVRLLLFGNTRSTREAVADMILGGRNSYAQFVSTIDGTIRQGKRISVVNTPDMSNPDMSPQKKSDEIYKFIAMSAPGPHAFVLVRKGNTFTEEDRQSFEWYSTFFGNQMKNHMVVVSYICYGNFVTKEFGQCGDLQSIPNIQLDDRQGEEETENGVSNLLHTVDDLIEEKGHFRNELFENAAKQKARLDKKREEKEDLEMKLATILSLYGNDRSIKSESQEKPDPGATSDSTRRQVHELQERVQRCEEMFREKSAKTGNNGDRDWSQWLPVVTKVVGELLWKFSISYMSTKFLR